MPPTPVYIPGNREIIAAQLEALERHRARMQRTINAAALVLKHALGDRVPDPVFDVFLDELSALSLEPLTEGIEQLRNFKPAEKPASAAAPQS